MLALLASWMRFDARDYYRIKNERAGAVCFYDTLTGQGTCWGERGTSALTFEDMPAISRPWDHRLAALLGAKQPRGLQQDAAVLP